MHKIDRSGRVRVGGERCARVGNYLETNLINKEMNLKEEIIKNKKLT